MLEESVGFGGVREAVGILKEIANNHSLTVDEVREGVDQAIKKLLYHARGERCYWEEQQVAGEIRNMLQKTKEREWNEIIANLEK